MPVSTLTGYDANAVANCFLSLAHEECASIDPMKIQKLVYLAHGWSLALRGKPLVRQSVEAWPYGPVIPSLYEEFREFRATPITRSAKASEVISDHDDIGFLQSVWNTYRQYTAIQLSALTHEPGSAWDITMRNKGGWVRPTIPNELIASEFLRRRQQG